MRNLFVIIGVIFSSLSCVDPPPAAISVNTPDMAADLDPNNTLVHDHSFFEFLALVRWLVIYVGNDYMISVFKSEEESVSVGTPSKGGLVNGKRLPSSGLNYVTYSQLGSLFGRTCVHHAVRDTITHTYQEVFVTNPEWRFVYGETGWCDGGEFKPHKTHQNGLSVDFMVPVRKSGESVPLPTWPGNKWGYDMTFTDAGKSDAYEIDFDAMAAHLLALQSVAAKNGLTIERVIFEKPLMEKLFEAKDGKKVKRLPFMKEAAWVRHDDHYHVDFGLKK